MRLGLAFAAVAAVALAAAATAMTKEGAQAHLVTAVPLAAAPGSTIRVTWTVDVPDGKGGRQPFGASQMFVQLLSRTGARTTFGFANTSGGRNTADAKVPVGGIGGIRIGLRGTTDIFFPLMNDPFASPGGGRCDVATLRGTLRAFVRAYNRGDLRRLDRLFSRANFVWYSSGSPGTRLGGAAADRGTLVAYFGRRHLQHDRLSLLTFRFNGYEPGRHLGHFELTAARRADDSRGGRSFELVGKGALDCSKPPASIAVLSLGGPER